MNSLLDTGVKPLGDLVKMKPVSQYANGGYVSTAVADLSVPPPINLKVGGPSSENFGMSDGEIMTEYKGPSRMTDTPGVFTEYYTGPYGSFSSQKTEGAPGATQMYENFLLRGKVLDPIIKENLRNATGIPSLLEANVQYDIPKTIQYGLNRTPEMQVFGRPFSSGIVSLMNGGQPEPKTGLQKLIETNNYRNIL
jgi:hypothetical protein